MTGRNTPLRPRCDGGNRNTPPPRGRSGVATPPARVTPARPASRNAAVSPVATPLLAQVSVLPADHAHGLRVVLVCPHGTSRATLLGVPQDWAPDLSAVLPVLAAWHERHEGCGCAASVTTKEVRA